ncbi:MAG: acyl carrier protein [Lachnospiraceae bacterium]
MKEKVISILFETIPDYEEYKGDDFVKDDLIDSMVLLEIISEIEEKFDIEIPAEKMKSDNFRNVDTIIALIESIN